MPRKQASRSSIAAVPDVSPAQRPDSASHPPKEPQTQPQSVNIDRILGGDPEFADTFFGAVSFALEFLL